MAGCPGPSSEKAAVAAAAAAAVPGRLPDDEEGPPPYDIVVNVGPAAAVTSSHLHPVREEPAFPDSGRSSCSVDVNQRPSLGAILPRDVSRLSALREDAGNASRAGSAWSTLQAGPQLVAASALGAVYTAPGTQLPATQFLRQEDVFRPPNATELRRMATCCWLSCVMHVVTWLCVALLIWIHVTREERYATKWEYRLHMAVTATFLIIGLAFVVGEILQAEPTPYVMHATDLEGARRQIKQLRRASPKVYVEAEVVRTRYYRGGDTAQTVVFRDRKRLFIDYWRDFSRDFEVNAQLEFPMTKVKIRAAVCFLDEATLAHYQQLAAKLQERARKRMRQGHRLLVKPYIEIPGDPGHLGLWSSSSSGGSPGTPSRLGLALLYWLLSLLLCCYPVRLLMRRFWMAGDPQVYTVAKAVGIINY